VTGSLGRIQSLAQSAFPSPAYSRNLRRTVFLQLLAFYLQLFTKLTSARNLPQPIKSLHRQPCAEKGCKGIAEVDVAVVEGRIGKCRKAFER